MSRAGRERLALYYSTMSSRASSTEEPHIEALLEAYGGLDDLMVLALGSTYWSPPEEALKEMTHSILNKVINSRCTH